ncbi:hypothetical protein FOWG_17973 [Fusarium oxysporum f. sp. lycopersici MN25]|nr:hypothetical protein FOWG_17973 [Fusarium oxysporum f. sp. lycopersici MN25]
MLGTTLVSASPLLRTPSRAVALSWTTSSSTPPDAMKSSTTASFPYRPPIQ